MTAWVLRAVAAVVAFVAARAIAEKYSDLLYDLSRAVGNP